MPGLAVEPYVNGTRGPHDKACAGLRNYGELGIRKAEGEQTSLPLSIKFRPACHEARDTDGWGMGL